MIKSMFRWVLLAVAMLSYTQVMAFESPSGYISGNDSVGLAIYAEPIKPMPVKLVETQALFNTLTTLETKVSAGTYVVSYSELTTCHQPASIERGYIRVVNM